MVSTYPHPDAPIYPKPGSWAQQGMDCGATLEEALRTDLYVRKYWRPGDESYVAMLSRLQREWKGFFEQKAGGTTHGRHTDG